MLPMFCKIDAGNFDNFNICDSYLLNDNELAEQGEVLNNSWLVCCANIYDGNQTENRIYHTGEYIRLFDLTQIYMFSSDVEINHPDFKSIGKSICVDFVSKVYNIFCYENINYDPKNRRSKKIAHIIR